MPYARDGVALVLSGGGSLGAVQAGLLRALFNTGFRPSLIVGASVGALNGAYLAFHPNARGADGLVDVWRSLRDAKLFDRNPFRMAYHLASKRACVLSTELLESVIRRHLPEDDFAATDVPLYITATNLTKGVKSVFSEGPVSRAVMASTAIPGLFCPIEIDRDLYVDGGVTANVDLETAVELGAKEIVAIEVGGGRFDGRDPSITSVVARSLDIMMRGRVEADLEHLSERAHITIVRPPVEEAVGLGMLDFANVEKLIRRAERFGEHLLAEHRDGDGRFEAGIIERPDEAALTAHDLALRGVAHQP